MLQRDPNYRRLKAGGRGPLSSSTYWAGPDHLLIVVIPGYAENYRRFLYADIQAVVVSRTRMRLVWGLAFAAFSLPGLFAGLALVGSQPIGAGILIAVAGFFLVLLLVNALRGPCCTCSLSTAVQTTPLPNLTRWRRAQALVSELTPRIMEAQAKLGQGAPIESPPAGAPAPVSAPGPAAAASNYVVDDPNAPPRILS